MFIDTHLHLSYNEGINPKEFIENAKNAGVRYLILSCCDKNSIIEGLKLIKEYDNLFLSIGFHPEVVSEITSEDYKWLKDIVSNCPRVVAIGEIGLDYYLEKEQKELQKEMFRKQLDIAKELELPVVIHTRDAIQDTYDILSEYNLKGVIHCYSGSVDMAEKFIKLGYLLGIGGVVTFSNSKLYQVVEKVGLSNIVLETDSPYLSPVPYRGKVNESKNIPIIAEKIGEILDIKIDDVACVTTANAVKLFDLNIKL